MWQVPVGWINHPIKPIPSLTNSQFEWKPVGANRRRKPKALACHNARVGFSSWQFLSIQDVYELLKVRFSTARVFLESYAAWEVGASTLWGYSVREYARSGSPQWS